MNAASFSGKAQFGINPEDARQLAGMQSLPFSLPVLNLKSNDRALDKNAYKALKSRSFKNITYKLSTAIVQARDVSQYLVKTTVELSIEGVTRVIAMDVYCMVNKDDTMTCKGSEHLNWLHLLFEMPGARFCHSD